MLDPTSLLLIAVIGLVAGVLGGMLGVGGSVIMIPALAVVIGPDQHLYQAAAMIVNVFVAIPATLRHRKAGAVMPRVLTPMLPAAVIFILLGVWVSNLPVFTGDEGERWLGRVLAVFLVYVIIVNIRKLRAKSDDEEAVPDSVSPARAAGVGAAMGTSAGVMGIGGGALAVPMQHVLLKLPLRNAIANSAAVMCVSAGIGALYKNATLAPHGVDLQDSLVIAALLTPTAILGARVGASLTHRLPIRQVRVAFVCLMVVAAWKMAAIPGSPI